MVYPELVGYSVNDHLSIGCTTIAVDNPTFDDVSFESTSKDGADRGSERMEPMPVGNVGLTHGCEWLMRVKIW